MPTLDIMAGESLDNILIKINTLISSLELELVTENSQSINLFGAGTSVSPLYGQVNISSSPSNVLELNPDGLYVAATLAENLQQVLTAGNTATLPMQLQVTSFEELAALLGNQGLTIGYVSTSPGFVPASAIIQAGASGAGSDPANGGVLTLTGTAAVQIATEDGKIVLLAQKVPASSNPLSGQVEIVGHGDTRVGRGTSSTTYTGSVVFPEVGGAFISGTDPANISDSSYISLSDPGTPGIRMFSSTAVYVATSSASTDSLFHVGPPGTGGHPSVISGWFEGRVRGEDAVNSNEFVTKAQIDALPVAVNADWNATTGLAEILNKPNVILNQTTQQPSSNAYLSGFFAATAARFGGGFSTGDYALSVGSLPSSLNVAANFDGRIQIHDAVNNNDAVTKQQLDASVASPAGTNGQVQFNNSGVFGADSDLVWDNTNKRLGIGAASPSVKLHVQGDIYATEGALFSSFTDSTGGRLQLRNDTKPDVAGLRWITFNMDSSYGAGLQFWRYPGTTNDGIRSVVFFDNGNVGIGDISTTTAKLDIDGQIRIRGGVPGVNKVLASSDINGNALWSDLSTLVPTIYTGNSALTSNRIVDGAGFDLTFDLVNNLTLNGTAMLNTLFDTGTSIRSTDYELKLDPSTNSASLETFAGNKFLINDNDTSVISVVRDVLINSQRHTTITAAANGNITLTRSGTGNIIFTGINNPGGQFLTTNGSGVVSLASVPVTSTIVATSIATTAVTQTYMNTNHASAPIGSRILFTNLSDDATKVLVVNKLTATTWSANIDTKLT